MAIEKTDGLLNEIASKLGYACLSDLRFISDYSKLPAVLQSISIDKYSLDEWNDAVMYIGCQVDRAEVTYDTPQEAYCHILNISRKHAKASL